jgi:hypothetical protein
MEITIRIKELFITDTTQHSKRTLPCYLSTETNLVSKTMCSFENTTRWAKSRNQCEIPGFRSSEYEDYDAV